MALPVPIQQLDTLHSVTLNPFFDALIKAIYSGSTDQNFWDVLKNFWLLLPDYIIAIMLRIFSFSFLLSLILIFIIIWTARNLMRIRNEMHQALKLPNKPEPKVASALPPVVNEKWEKVLAHINSVNPSDWKLAILECDIMLSDILEKMGYMQESIGEKLKSIEPSDFTNIEAAWEAHKIRNQIAHEGSEFMINEREAKRVIGLYEVVFREFEYI
jgi:hypothetical protein